MRAARRVLSLGLLIVGLYIGALTFTILRSPGHVRPLFEGIGPITPYKWVNPPPEFAAGNQQPANLSTEVPLGPEGSQNATGLTTHDGQCLVSLADGAIPPSPPATNVAVAIDPLDPAKLASLPGGLRADGNAYAVSMRYRPGDQPASVQHAGNVIMQVPAPAEAVFFSVDGKSWAKLEVKNLGGTVAIGATFASPGYYVAGTSAALTKSSTGGGNSIVRRVLLTVALTAGLTALFIAPGAIKDWRAKRRRSKA